MNAQTCKPRPVKYCADCQTVIAGPDTPTNVYNRIKYCPECARERKLWSDANAKKRKRLDRKERNRLLREQCRLLRQENSALRQRLDALEKMYGEARGYA